MKNQSIIFYILVFLVAVTFSVIGWLYQYHSSLSYNTTFYSALFLSIGLLLLLFRLQNKYYNTQLTEISGTIDRDWLQGLFNSFPMGMLIVDSKSRILYANQQTCIIFNTDEVAITEHTIETLVNKEAKRFFIESIAKADRSPLWRDEFLVSGDKKAYTWFALNVCTIPLTKTKPGIWSMTVEEVTAKRTLRAKLDKIRTEQALILDHTTVGLALVVDKQIVRANNALGQLLGRYSSSMVNQPWEKVIYGQDDETDILDKVVGELSNNDHFESEIRLLRDDGKSFWSRITAKAASLRSMKSGIIISFEDATNKREQDDELRQAAVVFEASSDAIMVLDEDGLIRMVNSSFSKMTGFSETDILGKTPRLLRATREDERRYDIMWEAVLKNGHWRGELWRRKKSGETYPEWTSISAVTDSQDRVLEYVVIGSDMSDRKYAEDRILHQANYDQLTSLPNRNLFMDRLHQSLTRVKRDGTQLALLFIDLDRFKNINDSLGHSAGDKLLVEVAKMMKHIIRDSDTIARFGGDEFAVILSPVFGPKNASRVANSVLEVLSQPINLDGYETIIGASIGISMYPADGTVEDVLVKNADTAMYRAKESGRNNYQFFTEEMQQSAKDRLTMEQDLRQAIERQELRLVFQPQVELSNNSLCGTEVLVRWQSSEKGLVSPGEFIYLAEDTGLIVPIGEWVL
ncbi:MAG: diguanylate cyclase, partial [Gammaproteobacteria bacterium]|nr:diguanylate cyclase [Gammaproteobacteria bacterium]